MKEYMFYIRNTKNAKQDLSPQDHLSFVKQCESYIGHLKKENRLIAAQPVLNEGKMLRKSNDGWIEADVATDEEVYVGYYHIRALDMQDAINIAKNNPEFGYVPSASVEIHQVKTMENSTGFVYPKGESGN
jgi:hypothetical protein